MKSVKIMFDSHKKLWILPDGSTTPSFDWEKFKKFAPEANLDLRSTEPTTRTRVTAMSGEEYYNKYYGRHSRPKMEREKVDRVLDTLTGVSESPKTELAMQIRKQPTMSVEPIKRRVVIKKSSSRI